MDLVYLRFAKNVQRVHLITEKPAAYWTLDLFEEVGRDVPEYVSSAEVFVINDAVKSYREKIVLKHYS